jgi:hypothetical protein
MSVIINVRLSRSLLRRKISAQRSVGGRNISQINLGTESQNFRLESQNLGTFPKISEKFITFPEGIRRDRLRPSGNEIQSEEVTLREMGGSEGP